MSDIVGPNRRSRRREAAIARRRQKRLSGPVVSAVAAGAIGMGGVLAQPQVALAQTVVPPAANCVVSGTTITCTGDVEAGLEVDFDFNAPDHIDTLIVENVDAPGIAPARGVNGLEFIVTTGDQEDITIISDTGPFSIATQEGIGINAQLGSSANNLVGNVTIISTGDISASGPNGINADLFGTGNITVFSTGNITNSTSDGIDASHDDGPGNITVTSIGDITSGSEGINAFNRLDGTVIVTSVGNIQADGIGLDARTAVGDVTVRSTGNITTSGGREGIEANSTSGDVTVTSVGNISTPGDVGIEAAVKGIGNIAVTSTGNITSVFDDLDDGDEGISAAIGGTGTITISSTGNIITQGDADSDGIAASIDENGNITITSTGDVTTTGADGVDATVGGNGNISIHVTGNIVTGEDAANGIRASVGGNGTITIFNDANIDAFDTAIVVFDRIGVAPATITTTGILTGGSGFVVDLQDDGNDVVNLLPGSITNGAMDFGNGNDGLGGINPNDIDTLNFLPGLNATVDFDDASGSDSPLESAPEIINFAGGGVLINGGLTAVAVDATGFAGQGTQISDITDAIFNVIDNEGTSPGGGLQSTSAFGKVGPGSGGRLWGSAFGGHHHLDGTGSLAPFDHNFGGLATGMEWGEAGTDGAFGAFAGYSYSKLQVDFDASDTETQAAFGGAYFKRDYGAFRINAAFAAGLTDNDTTRLVNGIDAEGSYDGYFIAPSLTAAAPFDLMGRPMNISGRATYVYMHLDGYTETGIALPLTVDGRDVSLFNLRAQMNLPSTRQHQNGTVTRLNLAFGVDATVDAGSDNVSAIVAATPFSFAAETQDDAAVFLGLNITHSSADGRRTFGLASELKTDLGGGTEASGEARVSFKF